MATIEEKVAAVKALHGKHLTRRSVVNHLLTLGVAIDADHGDCGQVVGRSYDHETNTTVKVCWHDYTGHVYGAKSYYELLGYTAITGKDWLTLAEPIAFLAFGE